MLATVGAIDAILHETMLFAAIGFLIGGVDDLLVDLIFIGRAIVYRIRAIPARTMADFPVTQCSGRMAVFVPAWDESAVIGAMLRTTLARFDHPDWQLYVGAYPNDKATIGAIGEVAKHDTRVRLIITDRDGPTTKADCLNALWEAALHDSAIDGRRFKGIVLHDAEDVVHPAELLIYDRLLDTADAVQLPVLPLADPSSRLVSGHYIDEFAEAHTKQLPVRETLGAGLPLAGVGCAVGMSMLKRIAEARGGLPFDEASLTEDYELGLTVRALGGRGLFVRIAEYPGGPPVAVRAFFPARLDAAVRQKARWMTGIALAGWDRTGWHPDGGLGDYWMRMRDRRAVLAIPVLGVAYISLVLWGLSEVLHGITDVPEATGLSDWMGGLLLLNLALLTWRLAMRATMVARIYGVGEALWSIPRAAVGNFVSLLAARRAIVRYVSLLRGATVRWDKTQHHFPEMDEAFAR